MARKDVDLVIRAKDEAASVVDTITKALNDFVSAQAALDTRAKKTESSLGQLGAALATLDKTFKGLDVGAKLTQDLDKAAAALARIEAEVQGTQDAVKKLSREFDNAEASTGRYAAKLVGATQALDRQKASVSKAKTEQRELANAYDQSSAALDRISKRQAQLPPLIEKQATAVAKTRARYAELSDELAQTERPSQSLLNSLEASSRALVKQEGKLTSLREEYGAIEGKLRAAASAVTIFAGQSAQAATSLAKQERALVKITANYGELGVKTKAASQNQGRLKDNLDGLTGVLSRQSAALGKAENDYVDLAIAAGQADSALEKLSKQSIGNLKGQLDQQRRAMLEAKREYLGLTDASSKLAAEIGKAGVPTREMAQAFAQTKAQAALAKGEYQSQRETLLRMGQAFRQAGTDIESIRTVQAAFIAQLEKQGAITTSTRAKIDALAKEYTELYASASRVSRLPAAKSAPPAAPVNALAAAYRQLYGDSRKALSIQQRLRGEVLSLVAAYGGLYGVINLLGQVVTAYQSLEAATARLNVANDGDFAKTAEDMDFLRRTADRLGVDLGTLAQEYSKFSVATIGTNLEGAKTRKIFLSVAEAARVNRSSNEELSGVFVALTQIVSKGAVQMEELRQQLGDRLPGALQIMADGLGVTTAELIKMLEAGQVTSEALVPFAEELDKRFGPGLGEALAGTTVALGRLQNAAFQALVQFGNGGFIDSFTKLANDLTELLQSADFETFINSISAGVATLVDALAFLVRNFQLVVAAAGALVGLKLAPVLIGLAAAFGRVNAAAAANAASMALIRSTAAGAGVAAGSAAVGVGALGTAMRVLLSTTGIGLIIAAVGAGIALWGTNADLATEAMNTHLKIMDDVKNAYDLVGNSVDEWRKKLDTLTVTEAERNLDKLVQSLTEARGALDDAATGVGDSFKPPEKAYSQEIDTIIKRYKDGKLTAKELLTEVDKVNQKFDDGSAANDNYARKLVDAIQPMVDLEKSVGEAEQVIVALTGTTEEAGAALDGLAGSAEDTGKTFEQRANSAIATFTSSMEALKELVPGMTDEMRKFNEEVSKIEVAFNSALAAARAMPDAIMRIAAEQEALRLRNEALLGTGTAFADSAASGSLVDRIVGVESGGNASAKNPNSTATGLGQFIESTWLRMFKEYFPDKAAGLTDAMILAFREDAAISRNMVDLYLKENARILQQAGIAVTDANLYLAHFLGPGGATALIGSAPGTVANDVLGADQVGANASILDGKTREEIIAWAQRKVGISEEELAIQEQIQDNERTAAEDAVKAAEDAASERADEAAATQETIADGEFELSQQELINQGKERQAAIEEAIRAAKAENPNISAAEIAAIEAQTGKLFDLKKEQEGVTTAKERAEEADQRINEILAERNALTEQLGFAQQAGDTDKQEELRAKIAEVNTELAAAITNAEAMWATVGGQGSETALAQLGAAKLEAQQFGQAAANNYLQWNRVSDLFVNGLSGAFNKFSEAVANGTPVFQAAKEAFLQFAADFLIQIAQMIIQQAIFNALQGTFGGSPFGSLIGLGHTGGMVGSKRVGSGNQSRKVNPAMFAGAMRYHSGGIVGLKPGEVPIIAQQGEAMLTEDDPFHPNNRAKNGVGGGSTSVTNRIINAIDAPSFLEAALSSPVGERILLNFMKANQQSMSGG